MAYYDAFVCIALYGVCGCFSYGKTNAARGEPVCLKKTLYPAGAKEQDPVKWGVNHLGLSYGFIYGDFCYLDTRLSKRQG